MIFPTLKERDRVFEKIEKKEDFEDLTEIQMATIKGMYYAIESLENAKYDCESEEEEEVVEECIDRIELDIADMYVGYGDCNADIE